LINLEKSKKYFICDEGYFLFAFLVFQLMMHYVLSDQSGLACFIDEQLEENKLEAC
jgi:hypothetical protein